MTYKALSIITLTAGLLFWGQTAARAQNRAANSNQTGNADRAAPDSGTHANADHIFIENAARGGLAEVELGNLALAHASSPAVKQFARKMVDDHTKANNELKDIAEKQNVTLPATLSGKDKEKQVRLSQLQGNSFDKTYMRDMVADHRSGVAEFKKEANKGKDPEVKEWAGKTLPTLQEHLQLAESTESGLK